MTRTPLLFLLLLLLAITAVPPTARASDPGRRPAATRQSGTVVKVDPDRRALTIQEVVGWTGPGTGVVERTVTVTDATSVELVMRDDTNVSGSDTPGFREWPFRLSGVAPGDFVTVTTRAGRAVAVSIEVWRPRSER